MTVREELSHWVVHFIIIGCSSLADEAVVAGVPQILTTASLGQSMMTNRINCLCTKLACYCYLFYTIYLSLP